MLHTLLTEEMKKRDMSTRQVAAEIKMSHTTVIRALRGGEVDLMTVIKISEWLGVRPHTLINAMSSNKTALADKIAAVLERAPKLAKEFSKAADLIVAKKASTTILEDISAYAAYKLNLIK